MTNIQLLFTLMVPALIFLCLVIYWQSENMKWLRESNASLSRARNEMLTQSNDWKEKCYKAVNSYNILQEYKIEIETGVVEVKVLTEFLSTQSLRDDSINRMIKDFLDGRKTITKK